MSLQLHILKRNFSIQYRKEPGIMKSKLLTLGTIVCALFLFVLVKPAKADHGHALIFASHNDQILFDLKPAPRVIQGTSYVPVRSFSTHLGFKVSWDAATGRATLTKNNKIIILNTKTKKLLNGSSSSTFSYVNINNSLLVPYRQISEACGYNVTYSAKGPIARVSDANAKLTLDQLYEKYKTEIEAYRKEHITPPPPKPATTPGKRAFLTFDDGPNKHTAGILDFLKANNLKATFFVLKPSADNNPSLIKRMFNEGHTIACHGVTHDKNKFYSSPFAAVSEMKSCFDSVKKITETAPSNVIRTPYGSKPYMTDPFRNAMNQAGYKMWDWNVDSLDWSYNNAAKTIAHTNEQINTVVKSGAAPLVLLHDRGDTVSILKTVTANLKSKGYITVPLTASIQPYNFWNKYVLK
jgi:peptidoglycan-N-acetylglucosamine deacetylase